MAAAEATRRQPQADPLPGVVPGDEVYVRHTKGPCVGKVLSHGQHGAVIQIGSHQHRVPWKHVLAHKTRAAQSYEVEDEGEDGMIVRDAAGGRHFIAIPPEAREEKMVVKSMSGGKRLVFLKAAGAAAPYMGGPGLAKKTITDKNGVQTTRWVSTRPEDSPAERGHHVGFANGEHLGHGKVVAAGRDGVTVRDAKGGLHRVPHNTVTHRWEGGGAPDQGPHAQAQQPQQAANDAVAPHKTPVKPHEGDPDSFSASAFADQHDDKDATADSIISGFGDEARQKIEAAHKRAGSVTQTVDQFSKGGQWSPERAELHHKLIFEGTTIDGKKVPGLLSPERVKAATPAPGERPTFIALGGRGGSGKSSLNGRVYDESRAVVLDADHIKGMIPEYAGWNAHQVHEESSDVLESVMRIAQVLGLNIVLDATMKTGKSIVDKVDDFKASGFRVEAHYMHLPRQEAAKRAVGRFLNGGEKGRFVPPEVVMGNTKNEANFDAIKAKADAWSFHDNSGEKGAGPKLIASKGDPATVAKRVLSKSAKPVILFVQKRG